MARVAFLQDTTIEYMGYMAMSTILKEKGHTVEVFVDFQTSPEQYYEQIRSFNPDIVGFSLLTPSVPWGLKLAKRLHQDAKVNAVKIVGNVHSIINREEMIQEEGIDIVCYGEGETPLLELCDRVDRKESYDDIQSLYVKTPNGIKKNPMGKLIDMDALPFLDQSLYLKYPFFKNSKGVRVNLGRGCPFQCTFCTNPYLVKHYGVKNYLRKMSPERAVREIEHILRTRKAEYISIIDEVLWVKNEWLREFLPLYRDRVGLRFTGNYRFGPIEESDVKLLAEAGADCLILAAESGSEEQRMKYLRKPIKNSEIIRIGDYFHKYGIKFCSSCFFGLPGDSPEEMIKRLDFYKRLNPTYLWTTFFQAYSGIQLLTSDDVQSMMPLEKKFEETFHHTPFLEIPDKERLVRIKMVYFLLMKFPMLRKPLIYLTKYRIPLLFNILFALHFSYYIFVFERPSIRQYFGHIFRFGLFPLYRNFKKLAFDFIAQAKRRIGIEGA